MSGSAYNGFSPREREEGGAWQNEQYRLGTMPKPSVCCACGQTKGLIMGHWEDYSRPYTLDRDIPLCFQCHMILHMRHREFAACDRYRRQINAGVRFTHSGVPNFGKFVAEHIAGTAVPIYTQHAPPTRKILDECFTGVLCPPGRTLGNQSWPLPGLTPDEAAAGPGTGGAGYAKAAVTAEIEKPAEPAPTGTKAARPSTWSSSPFPPAEAADEARFLAIVATHDWRFAKTMPKNPHWYSLRKTWENDADFIWMVEFIRREGTRVKFGKTWYTQLDLGGFTYWTMGCPVQTREYCESRNWSGDWTMTILINRNRTVPSIDDPL